MKRGVTIALGGALVLAAVSTLGDFIWANFLSGHRPVFGLIHGTILFAFVGLYLGALRARGATGAAAGAALGGLAAGSFYALAPLIGYAVMFLVWVAVWMALGLLNRLLQRGSMTARAALVRGLAAAVGSGIAFYLISGIWRPFDPEGWDYAAHFGAWTLAYFPGFAALLIERGS
jgi:hypothetical protein